MKRAPWPRAQRLEPLHHGRRTQAVGVPQQPPRKGGSRLPRTIARSTCAVSDDAGREAARRLVDHRQHQARLGRPRSRSCRSAAEINP